MCTLQKKIEKSNFFALCEIWVWLCYVIRWEGFPKQGFPYLLCYVHVCCNISAMGVKSPVDFKYDVRIDVWDPQPRQPGLLWSNTRDSLLADLDLWNSLICAFIVRFVKSNNAWNLNLANLSFAKGLNFNKNYFPQARVL